MTDRRTNHEASCIREHHIKAKLVPHHIYVTHNYYGGFVYAQEYQRSSIFDTNEEALIAAMDNLIEKEKENASPDL